MIGTPAPGSAKILALKKADPVFARMLDEAREVIRREPEIAGFIYSTVLNHETLESVIIHRVAARLAHPQPEACRATTHSAARSFPTNSPQRPRPPTLRPWRLAAVTLKLLVSKHRRGFVRR